MTAITASTTRHTESASRVSWGSGLATGAIAAVAVTAVVVALRAVGVPLDVEGEQIPLFGFAQMVLLATVIGIVMARHLSRATFLRATVALTVLSCVPDLTVDTGTATRIGLVLTHLVAAAIVIPRLAPAE